MDKITLKIYDKLYRNLIIRIARAGIDPRWPHHGGRAGEGLGPIASFLRGQGFDVTASMSGVSLDTNEEDLVIMKLRWG